MPWVGARVARLLAVALCVFGAGVACADGPLERSPWYFRADAGLSVSKDSVFSFDSRPGGAFTDEPRDSGESPILGIGFGHRFQDLRVEGSVALRTLYDREVDRLQLTGTPLGTLGHKAKLSSVTAFVDVAVPIPPLQGFPLENWEPYIAGGAGVSFNSIDTLLQGSPNTTPGSLDGRTTADFAWRIGAGTLVALNERVSADLGYRFTDLGNFTTSRVASNGNTPRTAYQGRLQAHEFTIGVVIGF